MTPPQDSHRDHEAAGSALDPAAECLFDVRLVPHRSLSAGNFKVLMLVFAAAGVFTSLPFLVMGAWPVAGFMGLDVAILFLAFRVNFDAARAYEDILVTPLELLLAKVSAKGVRREFRFQPAWTRLHKVEHEEFGVMRVALCSRGRSVEVGAFLGADAKAHLAGGLVKALNDAKRGPRFS